MHVQFHDPNWQWKVSTQSAYLLCPQLVLSYDFELVGETESISTFFFFFSRRPFSFFGLGLALFKKVTDTKSLLIRVQKNEELNLYPPDIVLHGVTFQLLLSIKHIKSKHSGC